jgi:hypothetical protein
VAPADAIDYLSGDARVARTASSLGQPIGIAALRMKKSCKHDCRSTAMTDPRYIAVGPARLPG